MESKFKCALWPIRELNLSCIIFLKEVTQADILIIPIYFVA